MVESSGGGSVARWFVYLLPFFLFFGFFLFLQRRWSRTAGGSGPEPTGLAAVVTADSPQVASTLVRQALPPDGGYGLDEPRARD